MNDEENKTDFRKSPAEPKATGGDLRLFLQEELVRRMNANSRYSMRAFARCLGVDSSLLSKLLKAKRGFSNSLRLQIGTRLGMSPEEILRWKGDVTKVIRRTPVNPAWETERLTVDQFHLISDWYHYAIMELVMVKGFRPSLPWIAKTLGISVHEAGAAIERMIRLGILKWTPQRRLIRVKSCVTTEGNNFTTAAFRKLLRQIAEMSIRALEEVPYERRDHSGLTVAISSKRLPEIAKLIENCRNSISALVNLDKDRDQVYQLALSFFPLTNINRKNKKPK